MRERTEFELAVDNTMNCTLFKTFLDGGYDYIINIDIKSIIKQYNNGNHSVLYSEDCQKFMDKKLSSHSILFLIKDLNKIINHKSEFMQIVNHRKNLLIYNPDEKCSICPKYSYQEIIDLITRAENALKHSKLYKLLKYLLSTENYISQIQTRKRLKSKLECYEEKTIKLKELLQQQDKEVGIVKIDSSEDGISIAAGTKKDMALSDMINCPFASDGKFIIREEREYADPLTVKKSFYKDSLTKNQKQLIQNYKMKKALLSLVPRDNEKGFIMSGDVAIIITRGELLACGLSPKDVNWEPLAIKPNKSNSLEFYDFFTEGQPLKLKKMIMPYRK